MYGGHSWAKWQDVDGDWAVAWDDPSLFGKHLTAEQGHVISAVEEFSQSYTHQPKREHAWRFFHSISTIVYGCCLQIPLAARKASFIPVQERHPLENCLTALHCHTPLPFNLHLWPIGISADQGHDTAFVQK